MSDQHEHETVAANVTAFLVIVPDEGPAYVDTTLEWNGISVRRKASPADVRRAAHDVVDDMNARAASEYTVSRLRGNAEPAPNERVRSALRRKGK